MFKTINYTPCLISLDCFDDELPCFSVDELWNDNDLALTPSDHASFAGHDSYSQQKDQDLCHSNYFKTAAPEKCQRDSFEVNRALSRRSQFIIGSQMKQAQETSSPSVDDDFEQPNDYTENPRKMSRLLLPQLATSGVKDLGIANLSGNPRRISHVLPQPPNSPGSDDFEPTIGAGCARRASREQWIGPTEDRATRSNTGTGHQYDKWSSVTKKFQLDEFEGENWGILPDNASRIQRINSSISQKEHVPTDVRGGISSTSLDLFVMQDRKDESRICLKENSVPVLDVDFSTDGLPQR